MKKLFVLFALLIPLAGCSDTGSSSYIIDEVSPSFLKENEIYIDVIKDNTNFKSLKMTINNVEYTDKDFPRTMMLSSEFSITDVVAECDIAGLELNIYHAACNTSGKLDTYVGLNIKYDKINDTISTSINPYVKYGKKVYLCISDAESENWTHGMDIDMDDALAKKEASLKK